MSYKIKQADAKLIAEAQKQWDLQLDSLSEEEVPRHGYKIFLGYVENELSKKQNPNVYFYALLEKDQIEAIFELSVALPRNKNSWLKVLSIRTAPRQDTRAEDTKNNSFLERKRRITAIYSQIIIETINFSNQQYPAKKVKIYGNKQADLDFFANFIDRTASHEKALKALRYEINRHGNWLQIDKKPILHKV